MIFWGVVWWVHVGFEAFSTSTAACPNQIWRYKTLPIWGIQGHPELTQTTARALFDADRAVFVQDGADLNELHRTAHDALQAKQIMARFVGVIYKDGAF